MTATAFSGPLATSFIRSFIQQTLHPLCASHGSRYSRHGREQMPALMGLTFWHAAVLQKEFWNMRVRKESREGEWTGQLKGVKSRRGEEMKNPIPGPGEIHHASSGCRWCCHGYWSGGAVLEVQSACVIFVTFICDNDRASAWVD